jgi:hypothetical protein
LTFRIVQHSVSILVPGIVTRRQLLQIGRQQEWQLAARAGFSITDQGPKLGCLDRRHSGRADRRRVDQVGRPHPFGHRQSRIGILRSVVRQECHERPADLAGVILDTNPYSAAIVQWAAHLYAFCIPGVRGVRPRLFLHARRRSQDSKRFADWNRRTPRSRHAANPESQVGNASSVSKWPPVWGATA